MRHGKLRKQLRKKAPHFTTAEKLHKRRVKRKIGPSAMRRADRRSALQRKVTPAADAAVIDVGNERLEHAKATAKLP